MKRGQTDIYIYIYRHTSRLYDSMGPEGQCLENKTLYKIILKNVAFEGFDFKHEISDTKKN